MSIKAMREINVDREFHLKKKGERKGIAARMMPSASEDERAAKWTREEGERGGRQLFSFIQRRRERTRVFDLREKGGKKKASHHHLPKKSQR